MPRPPNRILVCLRGSDQNFQQVTGPFLLEVGRGCGRGKGVEIWNGTSWRQVARGWDISRNAKKCWLIAKPWAVRELFTGTAIKVTSKLGHKRLGAALGSRSHLDWRACKWKGGGLGKWSDKIGGIFSFTASGLLSAAFTLGLRHRWTYFLRALPDIDTLLEPLEPVNTRVHHRE